MGLSSNQGRKLNKYVSDYCVFDLETTGTVPEYDRVVEISAVKVVNGRVIDEFTSLVNPEMPIPSGASAVNGITDDMVKDAPVFETVLKDFLDFVGDFILVGHNIGRFDMLIICRDAMNFWGKTIGNDYIDTITVARVYLPHLDGYALTDLAYYYEISSDGAHRALYDCRMNQQVFERLREEIDNPSDEVRAIPKCPRCGNILKKRDGRFGEFWGCSGYPGCRFTKNI